MAAHGLRTSGTLSGPHSDLSFSMIRTFAATRSAESRGWTEPGHADWWLRPATRRVFRLHLELMGSCSHVDAASILHGAPVHTARESDEAGAWVPHREACCVVTLEGGLHDG